MVRADRGWAADNTDVPGAVAALRERMSGPPVVATILGGGATAASTALALCDLGVGSLTLLVRSPARAAETLAAIDRHPARPAVRVAALASEAVVGDVVVSTVPASAQTPDLVARCGDVPVVFDVLYDPWPTPLAESAAGRVLIGGLDLLVHQAGSSSRRSPGWPRRSRRCGGRCLGPGGTVVNPALVAGCGGRRWAGSGCSCRGSCGGCRSPTTTSRSRGRRRSLCTSTSRPGPAWRGRRPWCPRSSAALVAVSVGTDWWLVVLVPLVPVCVALATSTGTPDCCPP